MWTPGHGRQPRPGGTTSRSPAAETLVAGAVRRRRGARRVPGDGARPGQRDGDLGRRRPAQPGALRRPGEQGPRPRSTPSRSAPGSRSFCAGHRRRPHLGAEPEPGRRSCPTAGRRPASPGSAGCGPARSRPRTPGWSATPANLAMAVWVGNVETEFPLQGQAGHPGHRGRPAGGDLPGRSWLGRIGLGSACRRPTFPPRGHGGDAHGRRRQRCLVRRRVDPP